MQPIKLKIAAAQFEEIPGPGNYVRIDAASTTIRVEADTDGQIVELAEGDDAILRPFSRLRFSHDSDSEQVLTVYVGNGTQKSSARVGGTVSVRSGSTPRTVPDVALPGGATVQIVAADIKRRRADFKATTSIRWGDENTGAARGVEVPGGIIVSAETAGAVYVYSANPGTVSITEITE